MAKDKEVDEAFLREVDDELRRDQLAGWWRRWGRALVIAVGLGLIAFAGYLWWREQERRQAGEQGEKLIQAFNSIQSNSEARALPLLAQLKSSGHEGYRAAALLSEADLAASKGDKEKAAEAFAKIAADKRAPQAYRDLALIRQTALEFDSLKPEVIVARLKPLAVDGGPWFASAGEMTAIAYLNANKPDLAGPLFAAVARNEEAPPSTRSRTAQMAAALGIDVLPEMGSAENKSAQSGANE